jgi:hypothetical protein
MDLGFSIFLGNLGNFKQGKRDGKGVIKIIDGSA